MKCSTTELYGQGTHEHWGQSNAPYQCKQNSNHHCSWMQWWHPLLSSITMPTNHFQALPHMGFSAYSITSIPDPGDNEGLDNTVYLFGHDYDTNCLNIHHTSCSGALVLNKREVSPRVSILLSYSSFLMPKLMTKVCSNFISGTTSQSQSCMIVTTVAAALCIFCYGHISK